MTVDGLVAGCDDILKTFSDVSFCEPLICPLRIELFRIDDKERTSHSVNPKILENLGTRILWRESSFILSFRFWPECFTVREDHSNKPPNILLSNKII